MVQGLTTLRPSWLPKYVPKAGDGCVLWLPGQDDPQSATVRDRSGKGNNGTITGATWTRLGSGLWVLLYDGNDDYLDCGKDSSLDIGADDFSIILWFNCTSKADYGSIFSKGHANRVFVSVRKTTGIIRCELDDNANPANIDTVSDVADSTWHLLGISCDRSGNGQIYIDGVADGAAVDISACNGSLSDAAKDLCLGVSSVDETSYNFPGYMGLQRLVIGKVVTVAEYVSIYRTERHLLRV